MNFRITQEHINRLREAGVFAMSDVYSLFQAEYAWKAAAASNITNDQSCFNYPWNINPAHKSEMFFTRLMGDYISVPKLIEFLEQYRITPATIEKIKSILVAVKVPESVRESKVTAISLGKEIDPFLFVLLSKSFEQAERILGFGIRKVDEKNKLVLVERARENDVINAEAWKQVFHALGVSKPSVSLIRPERVDAECIDLKIRTRKNREVGIALEYFIGTGLFKNIFENVVGNACFNATYIPDNAIPRVRLDTKDDQSLEDLGSWSLILKGCLLDVEVIGVEKSKF